MISWGCLRALPSLSLQISLRRSGHPAQTGINGQPILVAFDLNAHRRAGPHSRKAGNLALSQTSKLQKKAARYRSQRRVAPPLPKRPHITIRTGKSQMASEFSRLATESGLLSSRDGGGRPLLFAVCPPGPPAFRLTLMRTRETRTPFPLHSFDYHSCRG